MNRYLVVSPHSAEDCVRALKQVEAIGSITHFDWGCKDGEHCGWVIIEAENKPEALMVVPTFERPKARAIQLTKFAPEDVRALHEH